MQYALHRFTILDVRLQCILCNKQVCWLVKVIHEWEGKCSLTLNSGFSLGHLAASHRTRRTERNL